MDVLENFFPVDDPGISGTAQWVVACTLDPTISGMVRVLYPSSRSPPSRDSSSTLSMSSPSLDSCGCGQSMSGCGQSMSGCGQSMSGCGQSMSGCVLFQMQYRETGIHVLTYII